MTHFCNKCFNLYFAENDINRTGVIFAAVSPTSNRADFLIKNTFYSTNEYLEQQFS
jgi:hypothetical protein